MADVDFIIVGGGAAGCALAARLSEGLPDQQVLLLDAGGTNADQSLENFAERHWTLAVPGYNWGYKTAPQQELKSRAIDASRGKGLGGSTAINFCVYTRGPKADYDHWAEVVEDDSWSWQYSVERFKKLEKFHKPAREFDAFVRTTTRLMGIRVDVGVAEAWDPGFGVFLRNAHHYRAKNLDHNSGDPVGVGVCQLSTHDGKRVTASGAYLTSHRDNLTVMTETTVSKVLFQGSKAVAVQVDGKQLYANKEIILSAGAIDSPKILLLSGIGPAKDIQDLNIPVLKDLPGIGKNLHDRLWLELVTVQRPDSHHRTSYIDSPEALKQTREQWLKYKTGPYGDYYLPQMIAYLKCSKAMTSWEFAELDSRTQGLLHFPTKPLYEMVSQNPSPSVKSPEKYLSTAVAFPGNHGTGEVKLSSSNPNDHPIIDPKFPTHPFDKRLAIESVRETLDFLNKPLMSEGTLRFAAAPSSGSDEDILEYVRSNAISMWHACGTVKMGKRGDVGTCVDSDFRVVGTGSLRVVDMSVAPFLLSAHLQAVAYLVGETAAEKMIAEYRKAVM